ncbi:DUF2868 domain-containing protein [Desulfocicer vacuolatum]|nr:DUF2868 domain-containing protein [Desulfocicer vacuolatum]
MKWTLSDIVDLEYFLEQDRETKEETRLKKRDRELYLNAIQPHVKTLVARDAKNIKGDKLEREVIFKWLELRRNAEQQQDVLLPGALYGETSTLATWFFLCAGLFLGIIVVASFFSYAGARPLNISYYLTLTLLGQLILLGVGMVGLAFKGMAGTSSPMPLLQRLLALCVDKTVKFFKQKSRAHLRGDHRDAMASALGLVRAKHQIYGSLFFWPLFILAQIFALGFNVGVIGMTLARVFFSDTAFGWQSTLQVGPELVHKMVSVVALPWSWLFPQGVACPTLEQIAGSRMILKDGIYHLTTGDLISWWPFLCFCVFFYGLLPRLGLAGVGLWMKNRCLGAFAFNHAACQRLLGRMTTPVVSIDASLSPLSPHPEGEEKIDISDCGGVDERKNSDVQTDVKEQEELRKNLEADISDKPPVDIFPVPDKKNEPAVSMHPELPFPSPGDPLLSSRRALVLVSDDLEEMLAGEELGDRVLMQCGVTLAVQMPVGMDIHKELGQIQSICRGSHMSLKEKTEQRPGNEIKQEIPTQPSNPDMGPKNCHTQSTNSTTGAISSIVWMHEAWQPPIKETLSFLRELRRVAGDNMDIIVTLVGKPSADTLFTPPSAMDLSVWQKKLDALGDPWLRMESMEKK